MWLLLTVCLPRIAAVWRGVSPFPFFFVIFLNNRSKAGERQIGLDNEVFRWLILFLPGVELQELEEDTDSRLDGDEENPSSVVEGDPNPWCLSCSILPALKGWIWVTVFIAWRGCRGGEIKLEPRSLLINPSTNIKNQFDRELVLSIYLSNKA